MTEGLEEEEDYYHHQKRKESRKERKLATARDRSKYKKSDLEKYQRNLNRARDAKLAKQDWLEGRILSILPQGVIVDDFEI